MAIDTEIELRPEVQAFAERMERALLSNDHKGGWDDCRDEYLLGRLEDELLELRKAINGRGGSVQEEAADVANFAMMLADNDSRDGRSTYKPSRCSACGKEH